MSFSRYGMSMLGIMGLFAATLAAATIWLVLTGPVTVPDAVTEEDITPVTESWPALSLKLCTGS